MMRRKPAGRSQPGSNVIPLVRPVSPEEDAGLSDAQLLERITSGDHGAFATLVRRHTARYFRLAYRFLHSRTEAEDMVQDAFLKLWERPGLWQPDKNAAFTTWFYRIVVNQCMDMTRRKRPLPLSNEAWIEDERQTQESGMLEREKQMLLERQIALLPQRQRTALDLCFYEGLSNQEAADIMGLRLKAFQALLMRAKTTLRQELKFMTGG